MKRLAIIVWLLIGTAPFFLQTSLAQQTQNDKPARYQDMLYDIKAFTARVRGADDDQKRIDALIDLSQLYLQIISDKRFSNSETLQGYRRRIASRLRGENKKLTRNIDKGSTAPDERMMVNAVSRSMVDRQSNLLAHAAGGMGPALYYSSGLNGVSGHFYSQSNRSPNSMNDLKGAQPGRAGGQLEDNGRELVNLIETILHPDFWQINGGVGTVYYYQPLRILVVRATTTVHEDLTHFLRRLR